MSEHPIRKEEPSTDDEWAVNIFIGAPLLAAWILLMLVLVKGIVRVLGSL